MANEPVTVEKFAYQLAFNLIPDVYKRQTLRTLADKKRDKILQYGERIWGVTSGAVSYTHLDVYKRQVLALYAILVITW